ncbi:MAG: aspartate aminotransferase [Phycisphaerae bacterium SM23_30]|nr:MAG: aspartate aminotransferase [Phycisphaerae bacterium SM23_30]
MDYVAERINCIEASGIRRVWQMAQQMKDPVDFSIGEPDFNTPEPVKAAAIEAIRDNRNTYTLTTGLPELRQALGREIEQSYGWSEPAVLITCGLSGALTLGLMATVNPGDGVLIPDPYFVSYPHLTRLQGGRCQFVDTYPDFELPAEKLQASITKVSKLLMLNSPANPTGIVYSPAALQELAAVAKKHNLLVFSDEIYRQFSYDEPATSIGHYYENTVLMRAFSKCYGVPGWRLGYAAAPAHLAGLLDAMATFQQYTFVCAPHPFQAAALKALRCDISAKVAAYRHKRDLLYEGLKDRYELVRPAGAFYAFVKAPGGSARTFVEKAINKEVVVIPGSVFSERDSHFRISYATGDEKIREGVERLCKLV